MPAPATVAEFLDLVQKSGVVDEAKLAKYLAKQKETAPLPVEPAKCAGKLVRDAVLTHFQAEQLLQGKWKRFTIGKYKVLEKLGVGGMGQVFLCEHKLMRRRVAVKVLPASKGVDDASRDRFYQEARAVAALDHPNIVRAYDIDQDEGLHFLVMEFVDGVNFQDLVKRAGPLDPYRACHYVYGAAVGLQYACETGIIHRDIKPGNILVDRSGVVKILDMGLARFFHDEDDSLTKKYDENVLGTADYLAPEQAVDSHSVTIRADLYSLGGTFYYLLTGQPPFPEGSVAQKLLWHQTRDPKSVALIRPAVPAEIVKVVEKLMMKDPADRYQTPTEVMAALQEFVQVPIPPPSDKELPQLSPAAMGTGGNANRVTSPTLIAGGNPLGPQSTSELRSPYLKTTASGGSSRDNYAVAAPTGTQAEVAADVPVGVWDSLEMETAPREGPKTQKTPKALSAKKLAPAAVEPPGRRKRYLWAGVVAGVLALGGGSYGLYRAFSGPATVVQPPALDFRKVYVTQGKGPENAATFKSVLEAVAAISKRPEFDVATRKSPPAIVLLDEQHEENPFLIARVERLKDLTIESESAAKPTVWKAPANATGKRVLELRNALGMTIRNVVFDVDNRLDYGLVLGGTLAGVQIENVTIRGAKRCGVQFENAVGEVGKPCVLNRVRVQLGADADCGIHFAAAERPTGANLNAAVSVTNCRVEGPGHAAVVIDTPVRDVDLSRNRIYNLAHGIVIRQQFGPDGLLKFTATNNTFHTITEGALSAGDLDLPGTTDVTFARNYFADVKAVANVKNLAALPNFKSPDNARDKATGDGNLVAKPTVVENFTLPPPKPDDDGTFLRSPKSSPLATLGAGKVPVGVPAE